MSNSESTGTKLSQDVKIYTHTLPASTELLETLSHYLPYCIPLLRRLQLGGLPSSAVLLATFPPPDSIENSLQITRPELEISHQNGMGSADKEKTMTSTRRRPLPEPFTIGLFDRSNHTGVQAWLFSSIEVPLEGHIRGKSQDCSTVLTLGLSSYDGIVTAQLLSLLDKLRELCPRHSLGPPPPPSTGDAPLSDAAANLNLLMVGTVHEKIVNLLLAHQSSPVRNDLYGIAPPFTKYLIPLAPLRKQAAQKSPKGLIEGPVNEDLPKGLRYTTVTANDAPHIMKLNQYIRHASNLQGMFSCGIRTVPEDGVQEELVAFGFNGHDGSVRTLHVDERYRGQSLATKLVRRLLLNEYHNFTDKDRKVTNGEQAAADGVVEYGWSAKEEITHTDISPGNDASVRVFQKLGAVPGWPVYWIRVDLERVKQALSE